jgi:hypothetical protein
MDRVTTGIGELVLGHKDHGQIGNGIAKV